jgi:hypothetical protein
VGAGLVLSPAAAAGGQRAGPAGLGAGPDIAATEASRAQGPGPRAGTSSSWAALKRVTLLTNINLTNYPTVIQYNCGIICEIYI